MPNSTRVLLKRKAANQLRLLRRGGIDEGDSAEELLALLQIVETRGIEALPEGTVVDVGGISEVYLVRFGSPERSACMAGCRHMLVVDHLAVGVDRSSSDVVKVINKLRKFSERRVRRSA